MPFDFELTFTGLCVLIYDEEKPDEPTCAKVLLAKTDPHSDHKHAPLMSFNPTTLKTDSKFSCSYRLAPSPNGDDYGLLDLEGGITVEDPLTKGLTASWKTDGVPAPETALDWLPPMYAINKDAPGISKPDPGDPNRGLEGAAAVIKLTGGRLEAGDLTRKKDGSYRVADFVYKNGKGAGDDSQVLADKLHLRLTGVPDKVTIKGNGWTANFVPPPEFLRPPGTRTPLVRVSITNLPDVYRTSRSKRVKHFGLNYDMVKWTRTRRPDLRLPAPKGTVVTGSSGVCPPTRWDG